jgi:5-formyltetrahydrofolate cyclo-ligase
LRKQKLLERLNHHPKEKASKDGKIVERIMKSAVFRSSGKILFYLPIHGEVDLKKLFEKTGGKKFILPRIKDEESLHLFYMNDLSEVEKGSFNILEPKLHLKKAMPEDIDLALIPGVVFAENGHRIGYGKGFYDRLLKKIKAPKIGIAYEFQIVENIPVEPHDTPMDMIVTEKRSIHTSGASVPKKRIIK